jgi:hypothetical protein
MPTVNLSALGGAAAQFFDNNGVILSGGKIYTYAAGTTTPRATYTSVSGATAHANPIVLDSTGRVPGGEIWLADGLVYKFVIETSTAILIGTYDNIEGINDLSGLIPVIYNANGNGSQVTFSLVTAPISENTTNVYINGVYQQKNTYSVAGAVVTFSSAPPLTSTIEISYF